MIISELDIWTIQAMLLDLGIIILLLLSMKWLKSWLSNVHATNELNDKDNAAFGISYAGGILGLAIMLTGVMSGEFADNFVDEALNMLVFGGLGLIMIFAGRLIQDKWALRRIDLHAELAKNNMACAFVDIGHIVAVAIIVRSAMVWVPTSDFAIIPLLLLAFVLSQVVILVAGLYRIKLFKVRNQGDNNCLQTAIAEGNGALALRYSSFIIGSSFTVTAMSHIVAIDPANTWLSAGILAAASLIAVGVYALLVMLVRKIILLGVDVAEAVDRNQNLGIAATEASIFVAIGLLLATMI